MSYTALVWTLCLLNTALIFVLLFVFVFAVFTAQDRNKVKALRIELEQKLDEAEKAHQEALKESFTRTVRPNLMNYPDYDMFDPDYNHVEVIGDKGETYMDEIPERKLKLLKGEEKS